MRAITSTRETQPRPGLDDEDGEDGLGAAVRNTAYVQSLERGLAVIRAFDGSRPQLTLSDVARHTGLTRAAARRFLLTLVHLGYVRTDGRLFSLRPRVLELGYAYLSSMTLPEVAAPHLERLVAGVHESSSLSVLDGTDVVYVARVPTKRIMTVAISVGTRFPAYATSMGRVLLAALPSEARGEHLPSEPWEGFTRHTITTRPRLEEVLADVAAQGYALVDQELEEGLRSVAVPVRDRSGEVVAALNISVAAQRRTAGQIRTELLPQLLATAREIEQDLSGSAPRR